MNDISMFGEVEQYLASGLTQREFTKGKTYTLDSFKYWIKKYRISSGQTKDEQNYTTSCFNEIHLKDHFSNNRKLIELVTKSGTHVTIYE